MAYWIVFFGIIGFLCLVSPTMRKELIEYFDLFSERRKKQKEEENR